MSYRDIFLHDVQHKMLHCGIPRKYNKIINSPIYNGIAEVFTGGHGFGFHLHTL